jgi:hypothetical protein
MWHIWGRGEVHNGLRWGDLMERDHVEDLVVDVGHYNQSSRSGMGRHGLE